MVVMMSRRIAVELYREPVALRHQWRSETDDARVNRVFRGKPGGGVTWARPA